MIILVDYDNIHTAILRLGVVHVVNRIVSKIDPAEMDSNHRILIRLYGGWYLNNSFTHQAQSLSAEVSASFPSTVLLSDSTTSAIVNCEMAYSILADPSNHLFSTYRPRGMPGGLKAHNPITECGCPHSDCPVLETYLFLKNKSCTVCSTMKPENIFYRGEQKLVDTMLTADLIYSSSQPQNIGVVSSDDDLWPGIKTTLVQGKRVIQVHTRNRTTPNFYTRTTHTNYIQTQL